MKRGGRQRKGKLPMKLSHEHPGDLKNKSFIVFKYILVKNATLLMPILL
jgi:hypothetical protein